MWHIQGSDTAGERALWASVVRRATFDYVQYRGKAKFRLKWQRAKNFLFGGAAAEEGATFDDVCAMNGWNVDYVRRIIQRLDRSDMKVLEPSRFKDEYLKSYAEPEVGGPRKRWDVADSAVPLFQELLYSKDYREPVRPKPAPIPSFSFSGPLVQWQVA
jgi:hypothetical protein